MAGKKVVDFSAIQIQPPEAPPGEPIVNSYYNAEAVPPPGEYSRTIDTEHIDEEVSPFKAPGDEQKVARKKKRRREKRKLGDEVVSDQQLQYSVVDIPPWYLSIMLGFQHYLIMFGATVANPLVVAEALCIKKTDSLVKSELIGTIFFVSGICTLLQTIIGVRLPVIHGGTFTIVIPSVAILNLGQWKCPTDADASYNSTTPDFANTTAAIADGEELWKPRIRELQGALMVASIVQVFIGFSGIMGLVLRFIGPLAIAPTIALAGLALFDTAEQKASNQWWITLVTIVLIAAFSQYTKNINVPCFRFKRGVGFIREGFPVFRLFPVILAVSITWVLCAILTATNVFPSDPAAWGNKASTNLRLDVLEQAPWFRIPYPGQWGRPTVSAASVFGILAGVLANMVETVGDYYACARMSHVPPPPTHAINRGIGMTGIGCIIAGAFGSGSGTTSYSENIGAIGITKVASRRVIQVGAVIMMIFGVFGKFGALFVTIPDPIIGGVFIVMFGMIAAVGISNLQFVDLNSSRNLFIIGFSFFFGLTLPRYIEKNEGAIKTGVDAFDQIFTILLKTNMFVGGLAGFLLDNTIPGTDQERGLIKWRQMLHDVTPAEASSPETHEDKVKAVYDLPLITPLLRRHRWTRFVPFLPTFDENILSLTRFRKTRQYRMREKQEGTQTV